MMTEFRFIFVHVVPLKIIFIHAVEELCDEKFALSLENQFKECLQRLAADVIRFKFFSFDISFAFAFGCASKSNNRSLAREILSEWNLIATHCTTGVKFYENKIFSGMTSQGDFQLFAICVITCSPSGE